MCPYRFSNRRPQKWRPTNLISKRKKGAFYGVTLKDSFQEYGISRKRYAVFCICVHKCSACQEKQMDFQGIQKSLPQRGKGDRDSGGWGVPTSRDSSSVSLTAATFSHRRRLFITLRRASKKDRKHIASVLLSVGIVFYSILRLSLRVRRFIFCVFLRGRDRTFWVFLHKKSIF